MTKKTASRMFAAASSVGVCFFLMTGCGSSEGNRLPGRQGGARAGAVPVTVVEVLPTYLENKIVTTGTLLANEEVNLRPETSGRVTGVYFQEGSRVKQGTLLLKLNDRELRAELGQKQIEEKYASDEEARKRSLHSISGISQEEYDRSVNAVKLAEAEKEIIRSQIAETEIVAPFDGVIGLRYVSEGSFVSSDMLVATMQDIDPIKVEFSVPEKYALLLGKGSEITVQVGETRAERKGEVYAVEAKIDLETRSIKARATIPNPDGQLIPGSFAKVEITLERIPDALVIPTQAVVTEISGEKAFVAKNNTARSVSIRTGIRTENGVQVVDGLQQGDTLIVTGLLQLVDGKPIEIKYARAGRDSIQ